MIESCNKKRMLLGIICLGGIILISLVNEANEAHVKNENKCNWSFINEMLTLVVLVVESRWTDHTNSHTKSVGNSSKTVRSCWEKEPFDIIEPCRPCNEFEIASKVLEACIPTHFKETVKCRVSGSVMRSCPKSKWIEEKRYWAFEIAMLVIALASYSVVYIRQRVLNRRVMLRIQKQLANGLVS